MKKSILLFAATLFAAATFAQTPTVSASSVTFMYCETTTGADTIYASLPITYETPNETLTINEYGTTVFTITNSRGCDSIVSLVVKSAALPGIFKVEDDKKVRFSRGNLQFRSTLTGLTDELTHRTRDGESQGEWRFAKHQYDVVDQTTATQNRTNNGTQWFDCFTYGSSGKSGYNAWANTSPTDDISKTDYDWGYYNAIFKHEDVGVWSTLRSYHWNFLIQNHQKSFATVVNVEGVIILPDNWVAPEEAAPFIWTSGSPASDYSTYTYTAEQWQKMEDAGAVFLPKGWLEAYWTGSGSNQFRYLWRVSQTTESDPSCEGTTTDSEKAYVRLVLFVEE